MGVKKIFEKRRWKEQLQDARKRTDKYIENHSKEARSQLAYACADEATALVNLGILTGNKEYIKDAAEKWDYASKAADESITGRGKVAKTYREFGQDARIMLGEDKKPSRGHPTGYLISDEAWDKYVGKHPEFKGKPNPTKKGGLEGTLAIAGLGIGIFFLSSNITGNVIADATTQTTSFLGGGLVLVGLVAGFFWLKNRK